MLTHKKCAKSLTGLFLRGPHWSSTGRNAEPLVRFIPGTTRKGLVCKPNRNSGPCLSCRTCMVSPLHYQLPARTSPPPACRSLDGALRQSCDEQDTVHSFVRKVNVQSGSSRRSSHDLNQQQDQQQHLHEQQREDGQGVSQYDGKLMSVNILPTPDTHCATASPLTVQVSAGQHQEQRYLGDWASSPDNEPTYAPPIAQVFGAGPGTNSVPDALIPLSHGRPTSRGSSNGNDGLALEPEHTSITQPSPSPPLPGSLQVRVAAFVGGVGFPRRQTGLLMRMAHMAHMAQAFIALHIMLDRWKLGLAFHAAGLC